MRDGLTGERFCWNGRHIVNVYNCDGDHTDAYSIGDFADQRATIAQFLESVIAHIDEERA